MLTGIEMMLKSMGVDPAVIKTSLTTARDEIMSQVNEIKASQKRIEEKLDAVLRLDPQGGNIDAEGDYKKVQ